MGADLILAKACEFWEVSDHLPGSLPHTLTTEVGRKHGRCGPDSDRHGDTQDESLVCSFPEVKSLDSII